MNQAAIVDRYGTLDPTILDLLKESMDCSKGKEKRTVRCPMCGFPLLIAYGRSHAVVEMKCRKCKFTEPIDLALFRTMQMKRSYRK